MESARCGGNCRAAGLDSSAGLRARPAPAAIASISDDLSAVSETRGAEIVEVADAPEGTEVGDLRDCSVKEVVVVGDECLTAEEDVAGNVGDDDNVALTADAVFL